MGDGGRPGGDRVRHGRRHVADEGTITYVVPDGDDFAKPREEDLPTQAGDPTAVTAVGERIVTLDAAHRRARGDRWRHGDRAGRQRAPAGGPGGRLRARRHARQPAAESTSSPVTTTVVDEGRSGSPIEPVRLGACSYAAWSGGQGTVTTQCGDDEARPEGLGGKASDLAFRVNRGQIVLNDNTSGRVWDLDTQVPKKIDNWNAFTQSKKEKDEDKKNEELSAGDRTPPEAKPDDYGARAGRTTVLHPLDNDSAPEGRLLSIIDVDQPGGGATARSAPTARRSSCALPEKARSTSFDYYIDDGRSNATAHATVSVGVRGTRRERRPAPPQRLRAPQVAHGRRRLRHRAGALRLARRQRRRHPRARVGRRVIGAGRLGSGRADHLRRSTPVHRLHRGRRDLPGRVPRQRRPFGAGEADDVLRGAGSSRPRRPSRPRPSPTWSAVRRTSRSRSARSLNDLPGSDPGTPTPS